MNIIGIREKTEWGILIAGLFVLGLYLFAIDGGVLVLPSHSGGLIIDKISDPKGFQIGCNLLLSYSTFCCVISKIKFPFIEDPLLRLRERNKKRSQLDLNNLPLKFVFAGIFIPILILVLVLIDAH
jgi:hypothetical protein